MKKVLFICLVSLAFASQAWAEAEVSEKTADCMGCHEMLHPGIVGQWKKSKHAAAKVKIKGQEGEVSVGCAECHTMNPASHPDSVEHNGYEMHPVVSPKDCASCHAEPVEQFSHNLMAHAHDNLSKNKLYRQMITAFSGNPEFKSGKMSFKPVPEDIEHDTCFSCHGTELLVTGTETRETDMGEMEFPLIKGWPTFGIGRINPDKSLGSCTACHSRHIFSVAEARNPAACKQCHAGPDAPAYKVYGSSKHAAIYAADKKTWNMEAMPWTIGKDFTAPTCASCHISEVVTEDGDVVTTRTHAMTDRLSLRLFGLIYAHPQPKDPRTYLIVNADGQPLPTTMDNKPASKFLISAKEMEERKQAMTALCVRCHSTDWVQGQWALFENSVKNVDKGLVSATGLMKRIWKKGYAQGLPGNPFDESIEFKWCNSWLIYANNCRMGAAMAGGGDYAVYADGRYWLNKTYSDMWDWFKLMDK